jgi:hypothetical protein
LAVRTEQFPPVNIFSRKHGMNSSTAVTTTDAPLPRHEELVEEKLVLYYFVAALTFMTVSMLAGLLMGLQLLRHNPSARDGKSSHPVDGE